MVPLSKISDVICGPFGSAIKNTDYQEEGLPLIRITNITKNGYMNYDDIIYITEELGNSLSRSQVVPGDIVISQRGSLGQCAIVDDKFNKLNISANIIAVKNIHNSSAQFIHDYFLSIIGQTLLERNVSGQVQPKITTQDIADLLIPVNCDERKLCQIVVDGYNTYKQKLNQADELLTSINNYILKTLQLPLISFKNRLCCSVNYKTLAEAKTFNVAYFHPERLSAISSMQSVKTLPTKKLNDLVHFERNIVSPIDYPNQYLGLAGVCSQNGELSGITEEAAGQAFRYKQGDVLYGRLRPYLNKVFYAENDGICSTEFHVMRVKNTNEILPEFLAAIMRSDLILAQTKHMMTGNTHPRISNEDVQNLYIPIPNIEVQREVVLELSNRRNQARRLRLEAEQEWQEAKAQFEKELLGE